MLEMKNEEIKQLRKEKMEKHLEVKICVVIMINHAALFFFLLLLHSRLTKRHKK